MVKFYVREALTTAFENEWFFFELSSTLLNICPTTVQKDALSFFAEFFSLIGGLQTNNTEVTAEVQGDSEVCLGQNVVDFQW